MSNQVVFETKSYIVENESKAEPKPSHLFKLPNNQKTSQFSKDIKTSFIRARLKDLRAQYKYNKSITVILQLADIYLLSFDRSKKAIKLYLEALELNPNLISIYQKIILAHTMHREISEAEYYYKELLSLTNNRTEILHEYALFKATVFTKKKNFNSHIDESLNILNKIIETEPNNFAVLNSLGFIILNFKEDVSQAQNYFVKALEINPNYLHSVNNVGVCYLKNSQFSEAENQFKKAIELEPHNYPDAYQNLAALYIERKEFSSALKVLKDAQKNEILLSDIWDHNYGWMLLKNELFDEAIEWYENKVHFESQNNLLYNNLGVCYKRKSMYYKAERNFIMATKIIKTKLNSGQKVDIRSMNAFYNLGRMAVDKGNTNLIESVANDILSLDQGDAFGIYLLGAKALIQNKYIVASEYYKQALQLNNMLAEAYPSLSFILECIFQDYEATIQLLEKAISLNLKHQLIANNLAYAHIKLGNLKKAKIILNQYAEDESLPSILATKGMLNFRTNNFNEGVRLYEMAIEQFHESLKKLASQIYFYEKALFYFSQKNYNESLIFALQAKKLVDSYMNKDIENLINTINFLI